MRMVSIALMLSVIGLSFVDEIRAETQTALQGAILIILDTVRADRLSGYGHRRSTSPAIDRLAKEGVLFENAISSAPWTLPSLASMISSRWVSDSVLLDLQNRRIRDSIVGAMKQAGYKTAAFTEGAFMSKYYGFDTGFQTYQEEEGPVRVMVNAEEYSESSDGSIQSTFDAALKWLSENRSERFFLLIHTYEPHTPYRRHHFTEGLDRGRIGDSLEFEELDQIRSEKLIPNDGERAYVHALYDSGIREADDQVDRLIKTLGAIGLRDRTLIVITSDHGEELGDHYPRELANHGHSLKDDMLHVPLIISHPTEDFPVKRVRQVVRTIDILPTIAEMLHVPVDKSIDGQSLKLLMLGASSRDRVVFGGSVDRGPQRSFVRTHAFKYIEVTGEGRFRIHPEPDRIQLYDLQQDPREEHNIAHENPELVGRFSKMLSEHQAERGDGFEGVPAPSHLRERLESLGYLR